MNVRAYASPEAFKQALEQRLRMSANRTVGLARRRQLLVFDRFMARVAKEFGEAAILKGGLALELRLQRARTTKDVDLRMTGSARDALLRLQRAGRRELPDFMTFETVADEDAAFMLNEGMQYEGERFRVECKIAGKPYGQRFSVDVVFGDPMFGDPDTVQADDTLAFAGIAPPDASALPD